MRLKTTSKGKKVACLPICVFVLFMRFFLCFFVLFVLFMLFMLFMGLKNIWARVACLGFVLFVLFVLFVCVKSFRLKKKLPWYPHLYCYSYGLDHIKIELMNHDKWNSHNFPFKKMELIFVTLSSMTPIGTK